MADKLLIKIDEARITDETVEEVVKRVTEKLMQDIKTSGIATISPRLNNQIGQYAHTLMVVEDATQGEMNINFIQHGNYEAGKPDKPQWHMYDISYWINGDPGGVTNVHLHMETLSTDTKFSFNVFKDREKLELNAEDEKKYLKQLLDDALKANPNIAKTEAMKESFKPFKVEVINARDLSNF